MTFCFLISESLNTETQTILIPIQPKKQRNDAVHMTDKYVTSNDKQKILVTSRAGQKVTNE